MSKRLFILATASLILSLTSSCEKDDLCASDFAATPRIIIIFKDDSNPLLRKAVTSLQVREVGQTSFAPLNNLGATVLNVVDSIAIPLKFDTAGTQYEFTQTNAVGVANTDVVTFSYDLGEVYVNRACGFKIIYRNLNETITAELPLNRWIQSTTTLQTDVTSNTAAHVEIRH
jgi:hypothetical protein